MNTFEKNVLSTIEENKMLSKGDKVVVGLSGGADSCALLCALNSIKDILGIEIIAAHLNHGIRGEEAMRDMKHSEEICNVLEIDFISKQVDVPQYSKLHKISEEVAGRKLRYEFFDEISNTHGYNIIAVAHNKNDRAETVILNLTRGSGTYGLKGISPIHKNIIRPIINQTRANIEQYLKDKNIQYVNDSTNFESNYSRNRIRNNVFPELSKINPKALDNVLRCSDIIKSENDFIDDYISSLNAVKYDNCGSIYIDRNVFEACHLAIKRRILMKAIDIVKSNNLGISFLNIESVIESLNTGKSFVFCDNVKVIIESKNILVTKNDVTQLEYEYFAHIPGKITVEETNGNFVLEYVDKFEPSNNSIFINCDTNKSDTVVLRSRKDGDAFIPSGMSGCKKLKKFFIDNKIPKHNRWLYPVVEIDGNIAAVFPLRVDNKYTINSETQKILKITYVGGQNDKRKNL